MTRRAVVIDTNVVFDVFVFANPAADALRAALCAGEVDWIATAAMRIELERVLDYPQIAAQRIARNIVSAQVLALFDEHARLVPVALKAAANCKDPDDQCFIDLAVAHKACLVSKDRAVLCMARRLQRLGADATAAWQPASG